MIGGHMKYRYLTISLMISMSIVLNGCQTSNMNEIEALNNEIKEKNQRIQVLEKETSELSKANADLKKVVEDLENQVTFLYTDVQLLEEQNKKTLMENNIKRYNDRQLIPMDESEQDESLKYFITDLNRVINSKDIEGLKKYVQLILG